MLIIEDGTAKVDAQSYATAAELVAFAATRGITLPPTEAEQETLLIAAMDYMETILNYLGVRHSIEQALLWPRDGVVSEGYAYTYSTLPANLKKAQLQLAVDSMLHPLVGNVTPSATGAVIEKTVEGAVSVKYAAPGEQGLPGVGEYGVAADGTVLTRARALLAPLLHTFGLNVPVGRA